MTENGSPGQVKQGGLRSLPPLEGTDGFGNFFWLWCSGTLSGAFCAFAQAVLVVTGGQPSYGGRAVAAEPSGVNGLNCP